MIKIVKELLDSGAIKQEDADKIQAEWAEHTKKLNNENKTLREEKEALSDNYNEVLNSKKDLDDQIKGIDDKIAKAKEDGKSELVSQLEAERAAKDALQESLSNLEKANIKLKIENGIQKAMSAYDDKNPADNARLISLDTTVKDGKLVFMNSGEYVSLEEGVKAFYDKRQDTLRSTGQAGSGAGAGGSGNNSDRKYFDKTSPDFSLTKQGEIFKKDPDLYNKLKG